jgi:hypothetical protein
MKYGSSHTTGKRRSSREEQRADGSQTQVRHFILLVARTEFPHEDELSLIGGSRLSLRQYASNSRRTRDERSAKVWPDVLGDDLGMARILRVFIDGERGEWKG